MGWAVTVMPRAVQVAKLHPESFSVDPSLGADALVDLPFGCSPDYQCHPYKLEGFPCRELCKLYKGSQAQPCLNLPPGHKPCFMQLFVADEVHPSWLGHKFMTDLVTDLVVTELEAQCRKEEVGWGGGWQLCYALFFLKSHTSECHVRRSTETTCQTTVSWRHQRLFTAEPTFSWSTRLKWCPQRMFQTSSLSPRPRRGSSWPNAMTSMGG